MQLLLKLGRAALWTTCSLATLATLVLASAYLYLSPDLPSVDALRDVRLQTPLRVYTRDGRLIGEFGEMRRTPLRFEEVPEPLIQAFLAAEDHGFFQHHGVDLTGLLRATSQLLSTGRIQTGGSTITMQVARNYFLTHARTFSRKFNEILLALQIERELAKEEILELYVNKIFLGNRAYGVAAAAQVYYGKPIDELNLAQLAMIAGLPKAPSIYNPLVNPDRAVLRRNWILGRMLHLGSIDQATYAEAVNQPVTARYHGPAVAREAGYVAEMARMEMLRRHGPAAYTDGYVVYTTVDSRMQRAAREAVINGLIAYDLRHGYRGPERRLEGEPGEAHDTWRQALLGIPEYGGFLPAVVISLEEQSFNALLGDGREVTIGWEQGLSSARPYIDENRRGPAPRSADDVVERGDVVRLRPDADGVWQLRQLPDAQASLVALEADTGAILSLIGGFDFNRSNFNRVTQAARQPGSAFKPFIYAVALARGYTAASIINDAPIVFDDAQLEAAWRPTNVSGRFYGPTRLRQALFLSRNLVSIRLLNNIGIGNTINDLESFGFDRRELPRNLSLALGSHGMPSMEMTRGFAVLANGGYRVEPYLIDTIETLDGQLLYTARPATVCRDCEDLASAAANGANGTNGDSAVLVDELPGEDDGELLPRAERVIDESTAFIMDSMLRDTVTRGTARRARVLQRQDLAGKTGTTNGPNDAWFIGYGGGIVASAWLGFDNNSSLGNNEYGGTAALPVWIDFMREALRDRPEQHTRQPKGVVTVRIDPETGLRARPGQANTLFEWFREDNLPPEASADSGEAQDPYNGGSRLDEADIF